MASGVTSQATRILPKLFVGNLPWTVGNKELRQYFAAFGKVSSVNVIFDKQSGFSRGYGFVIFADHEACSTVRQQTQHMLEGHTLVIRNPN